MKTVDGLARNDPPGRSPGKQADSYANLYSKLTPVDISVVYVS
jgi:hypothetical protein